MPAKIEKLEWVAIVSVAFLVWAPLAVSSVHCLWRGDYQAWTAYSAVAQAVTGFLTLLVIGFQAVIFRDQRGLMNAQLVAATTAANASKTAADAALAALERPWLAVASIKCNKQTWLADGEINASFSIHNHGQAPGFLHVVRVALFLAFDPGREPSIPNDQLPKTIITFPDVFEHVFFLNQRGSIPWRNIGTQRREYGQIKFGDSVVVGSRSASECMFAVERPQITHVEGAIPLEMSATIFLIGQFTYSGMAMSAEIVDFCYKSDHLGGMDLYAGKPYNDRRKALGME